MYAKTFAAPLKQHNTTQFRSYTHLAHYAVLKDLSNWDTYTIRVTYTLVQDLNGVFQVSNLHVKNLKAKITLSEAKNLGAHKIYVYKNKYWGAGGQNGYLVRSAHLLCA